MNEYLLTEQEISLLRAGHRASLMRTPVGIEWADKTELKIVEGKGYTVTISHATLKALQDYSTKRGLDMNFTSNADILVRTINALNEIQSNRNSLSKLEITPLFHISYALSGIYYDMLRGLHIKMGK